MDQGLVIVPAGAGAGKTHRIQTQLADWVDRGVVRPERIMAVSFSETAAGELRERIRDGLLATGMVEEAMAVERAYVSTIHGLGLRILTEHAFATGASPNPRHIGEAEKDLLIRKAVNHIHSWDAIKAHPERYGYAQKHNGESAQAALRSELLRMIDLLRGLGDKGRDPELVGKATERLRAIYGETIDPAVARQDLIDAVTRMLDKFPEGGMETVTANAPRKTLEANLKSFKLIGRDPSVLNWDWKLWNDLRKLFTSNTRTKTPEGYDAFAEDIIAAAEMLPRHPGPLEDAITNLTCLILGAQEVLDLYEAEKQSMGLIDYADMIANAEQLLRKDEDVRNAVLGEIDCVIVDEFQDTNPIQFAFIWALAEKAPRCLLVGDVKQSIMGFQGADPRLAEALADKNPDATQPLERNWRSTPEVMQFVNAFGKSLFGDKYQELKPTRDPAISRSLEVIVVPSNIDTWSRPKSGPGEKQKSNSRAHIADHIVGLLNDGFEIRDRHSDDVRPVRPSDIALLVRKNSALENYAKELRARGVPVRINGNGWAQSLAFRVGHAALMYAANPDDVHAALLLRLLGPENLSVQDGFSLQVNRQLQQDEVLQKLAQLADSVSEMPAVRAVQTVLNHAGLYAWVEQTDDPAQARADLLRLEAEAQAFDSSHRDLKAASGFHGQTIKVFLAWLNDQLEERNGDRRPDPAANNPEAVEILTWHGSKGREWPVTVICQLNDEIEERGNTTSGYFEKLDDLSNMHAVMNSAMLLHTPRMDAAEQQRAFIEDRREAFEAVACNNLYVGFTRARELLVIEWPGFDVKRKHEDEASHLIHVIEDKAGADLADDGIMIGGIFCPAKIKRCPDLSIEAMYGAQGSTAYTRFGHSEKLADAGSLSPWKVQPSARALPNVEGELQSFTIGEQVQIDDSSAARGIALHLAIFCHLVRPDLKGQLPAATGLDYATLTVLEQRAEALKQWLGEQGYTQFECEVPVAGLTPEGSEVNGTIDLLAIGSKGALLIDHKSGGTGEGLGGYMGQLASYGEMVKEKLPHIKLNGLAIHWIDHGSIQLLEMAEAA